MSLKYLTLNQEKVMAFFSTPQTALKREEPRNMSVPLKVNSKKVGTKIEKKYPLLVRT